MTLDYITLENGSTIPRRWFTHVPTNASPEIQNKIRELQIGIQIQQTYIKALQQYNSSFKDKLLDQKVIELTTLWKLTTAE